MADLFGTYDKRIKFTIDNTKIDAELTWFPITVQLTSTAGEEVFTELLKYGGTWTDQYEAAVEPDSDGWALGGTDNASSDGDILTIDTSANDNLACYYSKTPAVNFDNGFYLKTRLKISTDMAAGDDALVYQIDDGTNEDQFICHFRNGSIYYLASDDWHSYATTTTDAYHVYEMYFKNPTCWIYKDGVLIITVTIKANVGDNLVMFGDNTTLRMCKAEIDYIYYELDVATNPVPIRYQKVAFTKSDGTTELYADVELFDIFGEEAICRISRDGWVISNSGTTDFYMYYDKDAAANTTYIGMSGGTAAQSVYDGNTKGVWHMHDATTSTILDSTSNNNDGTKKAANQPVEATGKVGQGQDFDGADDYIKYGTDSSFDVTTNLTISAIVSSDTAQLSMAIGKLDASDPGYDEWNYCFRINADNKGALIVGNTGLQTWGYAASNAALLAQDGFYHIAVTWDGSNACFYSNGALDDNPALSFTAAASSGEFLMGLENLTPQWEYDGDIDEVHFSNSVARSAAWIKAEYNSAFNTLLTYGDEETEEAAEDNTIFFSCNF